MGGNLVLGLEALDQKTAVYEALATLGSVASALAYSGASGHRAHRIGRAL